MRSMIVSSIGWTLVPMAAMLCQCSSNFTTADAGSDAVVEHHDDAGPEKDSGKPKDAGGTGLLSFTPSNIGCSLNASALMAAALDAGIDAAALGDVDITSSSITDLYSDHDTASGLTSANVAYLSMRQSDGTRVGVYIANSWTIESTGTITLAGSYPIALVAIQDIKVYANGLIDGTSNPPGGFEAPAAEPGPGGGPGGGAAEGQSGDIGAGGGSYCGKGGVGSSATEDTDGYGTPTLIPLVAGSSGGNSGYSGGQGGGAIQLVAGSSIRIDGTVTMGGSSGFRVSGGGSGGAILIEAPTVSIGGTLAANGGGGSNTFGGAPQNAQPSATAAQGSTGDSTDLAGGNGSAGATVNGGAAAAQPAGGSESIAGGGGGAGYIRINTSSGSATLTGGVLSPSASTACMSQGKLSSAAPSCD